MDARCIRVATRTSSSCGTSRTVPSFCNPGSVGLAWRHGQPTGILHADPWAEYAVLDIADGRVDLSFRRVPFDVAAHRAIIAASGTPHAVTLLAQYAD